MDMPSLEELVASGVHFGHKVSRWNPKMKPFIFTTRNRIHVIDLEKTLVRLKEALTYVRDVSSRGGQILFVGTKRQAREIIKKYAQEAGMPYVSIRWLGGTFTNFKTIQKTFRKLNRLKELKDAEDFEAKYIKKERLLIVREIEKMERLFEGITQLKKVPEAMFVIDTHHEKIAVKEANDVGVKVVALVDTNSDPELVHYVIPGNDDATKSIELITRLVAAAVKEGREQAVTITTEAPTTAAPTQPSGPDGGAPLSDTGGRSVGDEKKNE